MLRGGAVGALGAVGFEALASAPQAQASMTDGEFASGLAPAVVALSQSGGSVSVDASQGNIFTLSLTASGWTIANPINPIGDGQVIRIRLSQDSTGGRTVSWDTAYDWGSNGGTSNTAPTLSTTSSATDILSFEYVAATSQWCFRTAAFPQAYGCVKKPAPFSVVQSAYFPLDTQGNFSSKVTAGNSIVLIPAIYTNASSGSFSTSEPQFGSLGNSVPGVKLVEGTGPFEGQGVGYTAVWLLPNVVGGATYVRLDLSYPSPGGPHGMFAYEVAGLGAAPQLDPAGGVAVATGFGGKVDSGACPAITQPAEIIFGFGHIYSVNLSAPSSHWTAVKGGSNPDFWTGYRITETPGTTYKWTQVGDGTASWGSGVTAICPQPASRRRRGESRRRRDD
jgi:hypothetical protein